MIHQTAIVDPGAEIGKDVRIGPYSIIGKDVVIGDGCEIGPHVTLEGRSVIGEKTVIHQFASIGGPPQDLSYKGEDTRVEIGAEATIREYVTVHRGTARGRGVTTVGPGCFLMAYCHVAHDSILGESVIMANSAHLGGHIQIGDRAILGGLVAVHQFARVGDYAMVGGVSGVSLDVPPYTLAQGERIVLYGLNEIGLKRAGFSRETVSNIKRAFKIAFRSSLKLSVAIAQIREEMPTVPEALKFAEFLDTSNRGIARPSVRRSSKG